MAMKESTIYEGVGKPQYYLGGVVELGEEWNKEGIYTAFSAETYIKKPRLNYHVWKATFSG
jgi:hypothetical protein